MNKSNKVFIATSLDGYIADKNGGIDWLHSVPNPDNIDLGYSEFISTIDAIVMGRNTFETVCNFDIDWPYTIPVFVLSNSLSQLPNEYQDKAELVKGSAQQITEKINKKGFNHLYIDGGSTIRGFLQEDMIDEMIITTIPILLGGGISLFGEMEHQLNFRCTKTTLFLDAIVQSHFIRM